MTRTILLALLVLLLSPLGLLVAGAEPPADEIDWNKDLTVGMAKAKKAKKIVMVCVNARKVDGERVEPAGKGLREIVYKDPRVVAASREFICVFLTPTNDMGDYAELSRLGLEGQMISPQHIFISAEGDRILYRKQYWSYGQGDRAVKALLAMMEKAKEKAKAPAGASDEEVRRAASGAPKDGEARVLWIQEQFMLIEGTAEERDKALKALVKADKDGDCTTPLIALLPQKKKKKKDVETLKALIRVLGIDGLEAAAQPMIEFLKHKDTTVRAVTAVSLQYIGNDHKKVIAALIGAAPKQKEAAVANHICRALGRCGRKDGKVRDFLLKMTGSARSEFASLGPAIGLAYFEEDPKARRGVEKILKVIGVPGGGRGGFSNSVKRAVLCWTLACIGDEKSEKFVREEMIAALKNNKAFWVRGLLRFYESVAKACGGDKEEVGAVQGGVRVIVGFAAGPGPGGGAEIKSLMDAARTKRDTSKFKPKGDNLLGLEEED